MIRARRKGRKETGDGGAPTGCWQRERRSEPYSRGLRDRRGFAFASCPPPAAASPRPNPPQLCATEPAPSTGSATTPPPITSGSDVWSFVSEPDLHPQRVTVTAHEPGTAPGKIFVGPYAIGAAVVGQTGALISDNSGDPVWFRPLPSPDLQNVDFKVQTYHNPRTGKAQPVLTWWQGVMTPDPLKADR